MPAWDNLNAEQKRLYAAIMENYAGYFAFTNREVRHLLEAVEQLPDADDILIIYVVGDNGASGEGGPDGTFDEIKSLNGVPTPIEDNLKRVAQLGGSRNPMVVSSPAWIKHDEKPRDAFLHLVDVMPTILEAPHISMPKTVNGIVQKLLAGNSFLAMRHGKIACSFPL